MFCCRTVPGQGWSGAGDAPWTRASVTMPARFRSEPNAVLSPGVTLVFTAHSPQTIGTGKSVTVLESGP
jgi:hypothetical protein